MSPQEQEMKSMKKKPRLPSTQRYLSVAEIRDNTVVLKDGSLRSVCAVSSVNFALKSSEEQTATVQGYIAFLNSLDFPIQIVIQSRRFIIDPYLEDLRQRERQQTNDLLRIQTADYRQFVHELVSLGEIVSKRFYVTLPYSPMADKSKSLFTRVSDAFALGRIVRLREDRFQQFRLALDKRVAQVRSGLSAMGLTAIELDTQALIELMYATYNPEVSMTEKAPEVGKMEIES